MGLATAYYHPFNTSYLGLFIPGIERSHSKLLGFAMEKIDLNQQPVLEPHLAFLLFIIRSSLVFIGGCIQLKLYLHIQKDDSLLKENAQLYAINHLVLWPTWLVLTTTTDFIQLRFMDTNICFDNCFCYKNRGK